MMTIQLPAADRQRIVNGLLAKVAEQVYHNAKKELAGSAQASVGAARAARTVVDNLDLDKMPDQDLVLLHLLTAGNAFLPALVRFSELFAELASLFKGEANTGAPASPPTAAAAPLTRKDREAKLRDALSANAERFLAKHARCDAIAAMCRPPEVPQMLWDQTVEKLSAMVNHVAAEAMRDIDMASLSDAELDSQTMFHGEALHSDAAVKVAALVDDMRGRLLHEVLTRPEFAQISSEFKKNKESWPKWRDFEPR